MSEYVFKFRVFEDPPPRIGIIVGDFVNNMRSALDYLAWELIKLADATPREGVTGFPIFECALDFLGKKRGRGAKPMWEGMRAEHQEVIEKLQPYHGGDQAPTHFLAHLRRLSNTDKHRNLHVAISVTHEDGFVVQHLIPIRDVDLQGGFIEGRVIFGPLIDGADLLRVPIVPTGKNPKMDMEGSVPVHVTLRDAGATTGTPLIPLLEGILGFVTAQHLCPLVARLQLTSGAVTVA